jgi:hypothetical protein
MVHNVQPYRWLYELREEYARALFLGGKNVADKTAKEAEQWMRDHAPWQDRPRRERKRWENPGARKGLRVYVGTESKETDKLFRGQLFTLRKRDEAALKAINELRTERGQIPYAKLAKNVSQEEQFLKRRKAGMAPLVRLTFTHNPDLAYAIWLEIGMGGRFSIIAPAIDHWGPILLRQVTNIANLAGRGTSVTVGDIDTRTNFDKTYGEDPSMEPWSQELQARRRQEGAERRSEKRRLQAQSDVFDYLRNRNEIIRIRRSQHRRAVRGGTR